MSHEISIFPLILAITDGKIYDILFDSDLAYVKRIEGPIEKSDSLIGSIHLSFYPYYQYRI